MIPTRIPYKIHFCFGFKDPPSDFLFVHYLAVKSAAMMNPEAEITVYYEFEPQGKWWEAVKKFARIMKVKAPTMVFGNPLLHYAHRADVFRMELLMVHGGIYLDMDTLCLRPFQPLLDHQMVMAYQDAKGYGLCNAVMLAEPGAMFLTKWYDKYKSFRSKGHDKYWDEHSVRMPMQMITNEPFMSSLIYVLDYQKFFYPNCHQPDPLFRDSDISHWEHSYCLHLWEMLNMPHLVGITPDHVRQNNSAYCRLARPFLDDEI